MLLSKHTLSNLIAFSLPFPSSGISVSRSPDDLVLLWPKLFKKRSNKKENAHTFIKILGALWLTQYLNFWCSTRDPAPPLLLWHDHICSPMSLSAPYIESKKKKKIYLMIYEHLLTLNERTLIGSKTGPHLIMFNQILQWRHLTRFWELNHHSLWDVFKDLINVYFIDILHLK